MINILKYLREKHNYTQGELSKKLGMSRQMYIQYETGKTCLPSAMVQKIAKFYEVDYACIIENKLPAEPSYNIVSKPPKKEKFGIRINIPEENIEKFKQVFLYILNKVGAKHNVGQTVLYKLLYFIDFDYYELYEKQLMGLKYIKNYYGPTPVDFAKLTKEMESCGEIEEVKTKYFDREMLKYLPLIEPDLSLMSGKELEHIDKILEKYSDKSARELSDYSHKDIPWIGAEQGEVMEYEAVFYRNNDTSVREYNDEED